MNGTKENQNLQKLAQTAEAHTGTENDGLKKKDNMELIKIDTNPEGRKTISGRELHDFLEVKSRYNDWFQNRVKTYEFEEGIDFITFTKNLVSGGQVTINHLSLDMAKELSMVERNEKGKQARKYFIDCEKKMKGEVVALSPAELILNQAQQLVDQEKRMSVMDNRMDLIEAHATTRNENLFTVAGYCSLHRIQVSQLQAADLGRRCAKLARETGVKVDSVPDARFGRVNIYHTDILEKIVC